MEIEYGAHSIKGKDHFLNEDRYRLLGQHIPLVEQADQGQIFAVFDGMGSAPRGGEAAQLVCDSLISLYKGKRSEPLDHICEKLKEANMVIHGWGRTESGRAPMGAAAGTVAWLTGAELTFIHTGDTSAFLIRDGLSRKITTDHGEGGGIFNFFGRGAEMELEIHTVLMEDDDILIICSDGVSSVLRGATIVDCVMDSLRHSADHAARELCRLAEKRGSRDDITAVVVEMVEFD